MKVTLIAFFFLTIAIRSSAQSEASLLGRWTNIADTTEAITLFSSGEFQMVSNHAFAGANDTRTGMWVYKSGKKRLILIYGPRLPKQIYKVQKNEKLGYTINHVKREIVFARGGINPE